MKLKLFFLIGFLALTSCKQAAQTVLVVGDSWATFVCTYKSLDKALQKVGITDAASNSTCLATSRVGMHTYDWSNSTFDKATQVALLDKTVKVMYLSLGGNDMIARWNKNMTAAQEKEFFDESVGRLESIIKKYQSIRPDVKILISGYDFPRFTLNHPVPEYAKAYDDMGQPAPIELNNAVMRFSERVSKLADQKTVFYIQHYGLMQYYYGNSDQSLAAYSTLSPSLISSVDDINRTGGNPNYQSDKTSMARLVGGGSAAIYDAFHLSKSGYELLADHTVAQYLKNWLLK